MIFDILYKTEVKKSAVVSSCKGGNVGAENTAEEKIKRSVLKTISWRIVGTLDTVLISYLITETVAMALSIGSIELGSKMILYFFHERTWNKIQWGK